VVLGASQALVFGAGDVAKKTLLRRGCGGKQNPVIVMTGLNSYGFLLSQE